MIMKRSELLFSTVTLPLDYLTLILAALSAYFLRYLPVIQNIRPVVFDLPFKEYLWLSSVIAFGWILIFALTGLYAIGGTRKISEEISRIFVACSAGLALILAVMVFSRFLFDSRFIILVSWLLAIVFISAERLIVRLFQRLAFKSGVGVHRVVIVGNGQIAENLVKEFNNRPMLGYKVVDKIANYNLDRLKEMVEQNPFD